MSKKISTKVNPVNNFSLFVILLLATFLRFFNLSHPQVYIFDEVYHAFTAKEIMHGNIAAWEWWTTPPPGVAYEWTHPPVAKYGMVLGMLLFGENEFGYRAFSAILGVVSIYGLYLLTFALTSKKSTALIAAFLVTIEGTHLAQSRLAMNDMYMLNFLIFSLFAAAKSRWKIASILYGLSLGSKWSAIYGLLPLSFLYLYQNPFRDWNLKSSFLHLLTILRYLLLALCIYILTFTPFILVGHSWAQWWELHRQMWYYHTHLVATHGYQSTPLQWLFAARPVWYWVEYGTNVISNIYVQGNPLLLWFGLVAIILQLNSLRKKSFAFLLISYSVFVFPWLFSPRIMFYYHYLPSAVFLCLILAFYLETLNIKVRNLILVLCTLSFLFVLPMLYGYPLPTQYWDTLFRLFPSWR